MRYRYQGCLLLSDVFETAAFASVTLVSLRTLQSNPINVALGSSVTVPPAPTVSALCSRWVSIKNTYDDWDKVISQHPLKARESEG